VLRVPWQRGTSDVAGASDPLHASRKERTALRRCGKASFGSELRISMSVGEASLCGRHLSHHRAAMKPDILLDYETARQSVTVSDP
jgi:hypothetical protein